jgi:signal transduction histidine kinase/DNA-binding NarL/FixJ family response regulator
MTDIFAPATALMRALRYPAKFAVMGAVVLAGMLGTMAAVVAPSLQAIERSHRELVALEVIDQVQRQLRLIAQHRGLSTGYLGGYDVLRPLMESRQQEIAALILNLDHLDELHGQTLGTRSEWESIKAEWWDIRYRVWGWGVSTTIDRHSRLIDHLMRFQLQVADKGQLNGDPDLGTFYLIDLLVDHLPDMLERLGVLRALGTGMLATRTIPENERIMFQSNMLVLQQIMRRIDNNLEKALTPTTPGDSGLAQFHRNIEQAISAMQKLIRSEILSGRLTMSPRAYFDTTTATIDIGYRQMQDVLIPEIRDTLTQRIERIERELRLHFAATALAFVMLVYLAIGFYRAVVQAVAELAAGVTAVASGRLDARVQLQTKDELAQVAEAFNSLLDALVTLFGAIQENREQSGDADEPADRAGLSGRFEALVRQRTEDLTQALERARRAERVKDEFLANMSHEIRTPMNAILGFSGLALRSALDPRQQDYLERIHGSAELLLGVLNDVLDLAKISAGKMRMDAIDFSFSELLRSVELMMQLRAQQKALVFEITRDPNVPEYLRGDPLRLNQVLVNLIGNALKFTESGRVGVSVRRAAQEGSRVRLDFAVSDTGIGLDEEEIAQLFRPFTQADASTTRRFGGTGLGLAICKNLVNLMGGEIDVKSVKGQGATFEFNVWLELGNPTQVRALRGSDWTRFDQQCQFDDVTVLLAEDVPMNRELVVETLDLVGINCLCVENGREALDVLFAPRKHPIDLVLMDMQMPVMGGEEATRLIRARPEFARLPVIALTAHVLEEETRQLLDAGLTACLGKPFNPANLIELIARYLPHKLRTLAPSVAVPDVPVASAALPAAAPAASDLPMALAAFDTAAALQRFNREPERYLRWLGKFAEQQADIAQSIIRSLRIGALADAKAPLHALKGQAGTLGLTRLHGAAAQLELALREERDASAQIDEFSSALDETLQIIRSAFAEQGGGQA